MVIQNSCQTSINGGEIIYPMQMCVYQNNHISPFLISDANETRAMIDVWGGYFGGFEAQLIKESVSRNDSPTS